MILGLMILTVVLSLSMGGGPPDGIDEPGVPDTPTDGDDSLTGGEGDDLIDGLAGNDTIDGGAGDDTLDGNEGDDWLLGGAGDDSLLGGPGRDLLDGGLGINAMDGGEGDDTLTLADGFETRWLYDEDGTLTDLERSHLDGGDGGETEGDLFDASGMTQALHLYAEGDLTLIASSPRGESAATLDGFERHALGSGHDVIEYYREGESIVFDTGAGNDAIYLANGGHQVFAGRGEDIISFTAEGEFGRNVLLDGGQGEDGRGDLLDLDSDQALVMSIDATGGGTISTGTGSPLTFANFERFDIAAPTASIDGSRVNFDLEITCNDPTGTVVGGTGDDTLTGGSIFGGEGDDLLRGATFADGGEGNDTVTAETAFGGAGDDTLEGAEMTGGSGTDSFLSRALIGNGIDASFQPARITDYEAGETVSLTVDFNSVDSGDPSVTHPPPTVSILRIPGESGVSVLVDGQAVLIVEGDSIPDEALAITLRGSNPWTL